MDTKEEIFYYDKDGNLTDNKEEAVRGYICEYDEDDNLIEESAFFMDEEDESDEEKK